MYKEYSKKLTLYFLFSFIFIIISFCIFDRDAFGELLIPYSLVNAIYITLEGRKLDKLAEKEHPKVYNELLNEKADLKYMFSFVRYIEVNSKWIKFYTDNYPESYKYIRLLRYGFFFSLIYFGLIVIKIFMALNT